MRSAPIARLEATVDGFILASSRLPDQTIRALAKRKSVVVLNRTVGEVASVVSDNVRAIKKATEHLIELGHASICYLGGPEASYANGMRWRGLKEAGHELDLQVRRIGPFLPTIRGGADAAERWLLAADDGGDRLQRPDGDRLHADRDRGRSAGAAGRERDRVRQHRGRGSGRARADHDRRPAGQSRIDGRRLSRDPTEPGHETREPVLLPARLVLRGSTGPRPG